MIRRLLRRWLTGTPAPRERPDVVLTETRAPIDSAFGLSLAELRAAEEAEANRERLYAVMAVSARDTAEMPALTAARASMAPVVDARMHAIDLSAVDPRALADMFTTEPSPELRQATLRALADMHEIAQRNERRHWRALGAGERVTGDWK